MEKIVSASAINYGVRTAGGVSSSFITLPIIEDMVCVRPMQTPFLNWLFLNKMIKWRQTAHPLGFAQFPEREMVPNTDSVVSTSAGGSATITLTPTEPDLYVAGKSIKFLETNETGIVTTGTDGSTCVVTRDLTEALGAQTWTAPSAGSKIKLLGEAHGEDDSLPEAVYVDPYMRDTRVQLFEKSVKMTDMMVAVVINGGVVGGNWFDDQLQDAVANMKIDIENAMWLNENHFYTNTLNKVKTKTAGAMYQIENNGGTVLQYGSSLDKADLKEWLRSMKLGSKYKTVFAGANVANAVEDIVETNYYNTKSVKRWGPIEGDDVIETLEFRSGQCIISLVVNPQWDEKYLDYAVALDAGYCYGVNFAPDKKGPRKFRVSLGVEADGTPREEAWILSHVGIGIGNAPAHGILKP